MRSQRLLTTALAIALAVGAATAEARVPLDAGQPVRLMQGGASHTLAAARPGAGESLLVWKGVGGVFTQRVGAGGQLLGPAVALTADPGLEPHGAYALAYSPGSDSWLVVWEAFDSAAGNFRFVSRVGPDGQPVGPPTLVNTRRGGIWTFGADIACRAGGCVVVSCLNTQGGRSGRTSAVVSAQPLDGAGAKTTGAPLTVGRFRGLMCRAPHVVATSRGYIVTWSGLRGGRTVEMRRIDPSGTPVGSSRLVGRRPRAARGRYDADGGTLCSIGSRVLVAWLAESEEWIGRRHDGGYVQAYDATGRPRGPARRVGPARHGVPNILPQSVQGQCVAVDVPTRGDWILGRAFTDAARPEGTHRLYRFSSRNQDVLATAAVWHDAAGQLFVVRERGDDFDLWVVPLS